MVRLVLLFFLFHISLVFAWAQDFSKEEMKQIRKAKTGKLAIYHGKQGKEFIRLMNLARTNPELCVKYLSTKYEIESSRLQIVKQDRRNAKVKRLRPTFGLHLSSWIHAVFSGWKGQTGHQNFDARYFVCLNFSGYRGENCSYGEHVAPDIFLQLMHSPGHRANILESDFARVGVSKKRHAKYGVNTVSVFSGPTWWDKIFTSNKRG